MDPVSLLLGAASVGGGLIQALGGRKAIDPNWLKQHFGAQAITAEFQELLNSLVNSPMGQEMMARAAEQGSQFANDVRREQATAGFGPGGGADSGSSIFAAGTAGGATSALQRGVKSQFAEMAMPIAAQNINNRMQTVTNSQMNTPTTAEKLGGVIGTAGSLGLQAHQARPAPTGAVAAPGSVVAPTGTASAMNQALAQPAIVQPRGPRFAGAAGTAVPGSEAPAVYRERSGLSRFGRKISRFGARFGNLVTPGNPFGQTRY